VVQAQEELGRAQLVQALAVLAVPGRGSPGSDRRSTARLGPAWRLSRLERWSRTRMGWS
jgi:hypothetical protein